MTKYITEKCSDILKLEKDFNSHKEEVIPGEMYLYNFFTKTETGDKKNTRLNFH